MMTPDEIINQMRVLAEAATPGNWVWEMNEDGTYRLESLETGGVIMAAVAERPEDLAHISNFNPAVVLEMLLVMRTHTDASMKYARVLDHIWDRLTSQDYPTPIVTELTAYLSNIQTR